MYGDDVLRVLWLVNERLAQFTDVGLQHPLSHRRLWPNGIEKGFFGHQLSGMRDQVDEEIKGFRP
jgi:hypothetical protein